MNEAYILEWFSLLGRWVHMITGIAWIGASFYFVWLDNHLQAPKLASDDERGVGGEIWSVHGGGFYHAQKYRVAPPELPSTLHWFKWEAYTTWISGMFLLALLYWYQAEIYLIDPATMPLSKPVAVLLGFATVVVGWLAYDALCKSKVGQNESLMAGIMLLLLTMVAWGLCQLFSGRGAYMHFGAMLGSIMVANVFFVIMPGQRDLVAAKKEGRTPDPIHGIRAKQRSVHNTYFTLPVLFVMISNHYAMTYGHAWNWLILIAISVAGALIRVYFVQRHFGKPSLVPAIVAAALLLTVITAITPASRKTITAQSAGSTATTSDSTSQTVAFTDIEAIIKERCSSCHSSQPSNPGFAAAPKGIMFDNGAAILAQANVIHQQAVVTRAMPIGNLTGMTDEERASLDNWFLGGALETR
ncbi:MAG: urate hydroxylase PuuD [Granulosicoccus sp.]